MMSIFDAQLSSTENEEIIATIRDMSFALSSLNPIGPGGNLDSIVHSVDKNEKKEVFVKKRGRNHRRHRALNSFWGDAALESEGIFGNNSQIQEDVCSLDLHHKLDLPIQKRKKDNTGITIAEIEKPISSKPFERKYFKTKTNGKFDILKKWSEEYGDCESLPATTTKVAFFEDVQIREFRPQSPDDIEEILSETDKQLLSQSWPCIYINKVISIDEYEENRRQRDSDK